MNCIAIKNNITIYEGGTYDDIPFTWYDTDGETPIDLSGYTAAMQIREKMNSSSVLISITEASSSWSADSTSGIYIDSPATGQFRIYIKDDDTLGMCGDHKDIIGYYDLFLYSASGEAVLKVYGTCHIYAAVTR